MKKLQLIALSVSMALGALVSLPASAAGGGGDWPLVDPKIDISNKDSLRRGAQTFVNYCLGCHSLKYVRYSSLMEDFEIDEETLEAKLLFTGDSVNDYMDSVMPPERSAEWLGITPPDLSLTVREKGDDWVYTFLTSFYADPKSKTGAANALWGGGDPTKAQLSMPFVMAGLQGWRQPVVEKTTTIPKVKKLDEEGEPILDSNGEFILIDGDAQHSYKILDLTDATGGTMKPEAFNERMKDLTNFLTYAAEPGRGERHEIGVWVLVFLFIFTIVAYLLKKEYWKDIQ